MEERVSSSIKLRVRSHDLGRVFRLVKGLGVLFIPCRYVLSPSKRRSFFQSPYSSYTESTGLLTLLTNDLLFLVFLVSNFILFMFGFLCLLIGLLLLYYKLMEPFVNSQDYISLGSFAVLAGTGIMFLSFLGFLSVIRTIDLKLILQIYTVVAIFMLAIEMSFLTFLPRNDMHLTGISPLLFRDFMRSYKHTNDRSYHSILTNSIVDILQRQFDCCGLIGPRDWSLQNNIYLDQHSHLLPDSCACDDHKDVTCRHLIFSYNSKQVHYRPVNNTARSDGCRKHLLFFENFVKGYVRPGIIMFQIVLLFVSAYLWFSQRRTNL